MNSALKLGCVVILARIVCAAEKGDFWSFQRASRPPVPVMRVAEGNAIDSFVEERRRKEGLRGSERADRRTLARRLYFDLVGLPPSPEELAGFLSDRRDDAYERLVDRLLASPRYGERWARYWLDIVHFGESHGYDKDKPRPNAWPYRDYVIEAANRDLPYSRFVQEQLAADVLFPEEPRAARALGFIAAGPWDFVGHVELPESKTDGLIARYNDRDDMVMTTMTTFLSLTVHCARCHDHKFDPIKQEEYYSLQAVFAGVDRADRMVDGKPVYAATATFKENGSFRPAAKPRAVNLLKRGDVKQPVREVAPAALGCLAGLPGKLEVGESEGSRRAALATWLTRDENFLLRRSIVNRVWQFHFGRGLVDSPNDFGHMGSLPTHPQLLDWLAFWFMDHGESLKALHKLILLSATYQQSSAENAELAKIDGDNRFLWRMNRTRLDAEQLRDTILLVSGQLDLRMGGPSDQQFFFKDDHSPVYDYTRFDVDSPAGRRRSVYRFIVRSVPDPWMESMDCPDASLLTGKRNVTLTPMQALATLNNPFVVRMAEHFTERLKRDRKTVEKEVELAFELALGRTATKGEKDRVGQYAREFGLPNACRLIFNLNEFLFVD